MNNIAILYDLDGTLIDSSGDIIDSLKCSYESFGYKKKLEIPLSLLGPPVSEMIKHLTPRLDQKSCEIITANFRKIYDNSSYPKTFLYEGVSESLSLSLNRGDSMFIVTNKMKLATKRILSILKIKGFFKDIITPDYNAEKKMNKIEMVEYTIEQNALQKQTTIMIGDSASDINAANANCIKSIGFLSGFGNEKELSNANPTYMVKSFKEMDLILSKIF